MSRREGREPGALVYGAVPRARLMPPEVAMQKKERGRRRGLIAAVVAVLAVTVAGIVGSFLFAANAEARLAQERLLTEQLVSTQLEFAELIQVQNQLASVTGVRASLAAGEVLWDDVIDVYLAAFSDDELVESLEFTSQAPAEPPLGLSGPLREDRVATIRIVIATTEQPEPWRWYRIWETVETFADSSIDGIVKLEDVYETTLTLNLNESALSQRFPAEEASP